MSPRKKKSAAKSRSNGPGARMLVMLGVAFVVVIIGVGLLKWSQSRPGKAALLSLGSEKMFSEVQDSVDRVLVQTLPGYPGGAAAVSAVSGGDPAAHDWPAPGSGPGAAIRCRTVTVEASLDFWEIQEDLAVSLQGTGAQILWGERLVDPARRQKEQTEWLRLDLGVRGHPTHTLVLYRPGTGSSIRWGSAPGHSSWRDLAAGTGPVVALVIDDWGHGRTQAAKRIAELGAPLTMAVLPGLPYSRHFALKGTDLILPEIRRAGEPGKRAVDMRMAAGCPVEVNLVAARRKQDPRRREIMLHLPMQPQAYPETDPGPDAILVGMDRHQIAIRLDEALQSLTKVTGVNNHMGSAATSDVATMRYLMDALRERDLLFVDSLTSSRSVAFEEAVRAGVPAAKNRIFLDYDNEDHQAIAANLARLIQSAEATGFAVGIGHPHPATADILQRELPRYQAQGVRFVTISEFLALQDLERHLAQAEEG